MRPRLLKLIHRWVGLLCALTLIAAAASGLVHILVKGEHGAAPPVPPPPLDLAAVQVGPAELTAQLGRDVSVQSLRLCRLEGALWYQVIPSVGGPPRYFSARDGREDAGADARLALELARARLGSEAGLRVASQLTSYTREYSAHHRLLPVYQVVRDGDPANTRLYVSTQAFQVVRRTDDRTQLAADLFSQGHFLTFIPHPGVRRTVLIGANVLVLTAALGGVWLFFATRGRRGGRSES